MGACPPPNEYSDYPSLNSPSPSVGAWDPGEWGNSSTKFYVQFCPLVPRPAVSTSCPGVFTYSLKQVQSPSQCNMYKNNPIPGLSSSLHSLPLAVLPNRYLLFSLLVTALPISLTFLFPQPLQSTSVYTLIWGTGHPLFPAPCQIPVPSLHCAFLQLQSTSKNWEVPLPREPLLLWKLKKQRIFTVLQ